MRLLFGFIGLFAVIFSGCDPFSGAGLTDNGDGTFGSKPAYDATWSFGDCEIHVELNHAHPLLAEYQKIVTVSKHGNVVATEEFMDTGGLASFYVFRDGDVLTIIDGVGDGLHIDTRNSTCKRANANQLLKALDDSCIGRFQFIADPSQEYRREYRYVPAEQPSESTTGE